MEHVVTLRQHESGGPLGSFLTSVVCTGTHHWVHVHGRGLFRPFVKDRVGAGAVRRAGRALAWRLRSVCTCERPPAAWTGLMDVPRVA